MADKRNMIGMIGAAAAGLNGRPAVDVAKEALEYAEDFRNQRIAQMEKDRTFALRMLDIGQWKMFALRWNLAPPFPRGWGTDDDMLAVMHKTRLMLSPADWSEEERKFSAAWLIGHSHTLPEGLSYEDGKLVGQVKPPPRG